MKTLKKIYSQISYVLWLKILGKETTKDKNK